MNLDVRLLHAALPLVLINRISADLARRLTRVLHSNTMGEGGRG